MGGAGHGDGARLLPRSLARGAWLLVAGCAVVLGVLGVRYHGGTRPGGFDGWVQAGLTALRLPPGPLTRLVDAVPPVFTAAVVVLTSVLAVRRRWPAAALAAAGPGAALLVTEVGKRVVGRTLDGMLAFPSGHTTGVASVVAVLAILRLGHAADPRRAAWLGFLAVTLAAGAIGVLMVTLDFHYATDVIGGWCVALAVPVGVAAAIDGTAHRRRRRRKAGAARQMPAFVE